MNPNIYNTKIILLATGVSFLIPIILTSTFKFIEHGIGPIVFVYSVLSALIFAVYYALALKVKFNNFIAPFVGALTGIVTGVLILNYFMFVTYIFGINNYAPM